MNIADKACTAIGFVTPSFVDVKTGEKVPFKVRHNTLSYMSAEAMAAAFGGDPSYIPSKIGFVYGESGSGPSGEISRTQTWDMFMDELSDSGSDVQIVSFSYSPSLGGEKPASGSSDSSSPGHEGGDYTNIKPTGSNAITFHAVSNSQTAGYRGSAAFKMDDYAYQAVLLGYHERKYYVLSRVSLDDAQKPDGFEIALDWTIVFR